MRLQISHQSVYRFDPPMRGVVQSLRLTPSHCDNQYTMAWSVTVDGATMGAAFRDGAGDWVQTASLLGPVDLVTVLVEGQIETRDLSGVLTNHRESVPPMAYLRTTRATQPDRALQALAETVRAASANMNPIGQAHALSAAISDAIVYTPGQTDAQTSAAEALDLGKGVCQDHAHALIAAAHVLDVPGRYVTGYLHTEEDGGPHEASHAWAELWVDGLGWVGFDPANRCCPDENYVRLGSGFDSVDAAPIRGVTQGSGTEELQVNVAIQQMEQ